MQIRKIANRLQVAQQAISLKPSVVLVPSVSMLGHLLTPVAVLAGVLGAWRLGADPGWTSKFFLADGLLSRHQSWFAIAIAAQSSAFVLNRWVANHRRDQLRLLHTSPAGPAARQVELKVLLPNRQAIAVDS